jgi:ABC-type transport system involved in cytochrome c biogenesis permease subunit
MFGLISLAAAVAAGVFGYVQARRFVRGRLRYVDAAQSPIAPILAGVAACVVAAPIVAILPIVGGGTALVFGISVGAGVFRGARDVKQLPGG